MRALGGGILGLFVGLGLGSLAGGPARGILAVIGFLVGAIVVATRGRWAPPAPRDSAEPSPTATFDQILDAAVGQGVMDSETASRLRAFRQRGLWRAPEVATPPPVAAPRPTAPPAPPAMRAAPSPATHRVLRPGAEVLDAPLGAQLAFLTGSTHVTLIGTTGEWAQVRTPGGLTGWVRSSQLTATRPAPAWAARVAAPQPATAPPGKVTLQRAIPPPAPPAGPAEPSALQVALRRAGKGFASAWKRFSADVAIHTLTYLGVLLLVVVVFVFFAGGFFGDVFAQKGLRPLVELGLPALLFGMAWLLRIRTGIPHTADAVGFIAALVLPICLSALIQDGATCPWCPPDLNGSSRWLGYVGVGVVWAGVAFLLARRRRVFAYLVGPALWAAVGAFGLFLDDAVRLIGERGWSVVGSWGFDDFASDGIAAGQLVLVVAAIAATVPLARVARETRVGRPVAGPLVTAGAVALPLVTGFTSVFAYADAVARGVRSPSVSDLAAPTVAAAGLACLGLLAARGAAFAWASWGPRARRGVSEALTSGAYVLGTAAWVLTAGLGIPAGWVGAGLVGGGILVGVVERRTASSSGRWMSRGLAAAGLVLSFWDAGATTVTWGAGAAVLLVRPVWPALRRGLSGLIPEGLAGRWDAPALWSGALVALGPGAARLAGAGGAPWMLAGGALALGACRFLPAPMQAARSLSTLPAAALGLSGVGLAAWQAAKAGPAGLVATGVVLLLAAGATALAAVPALSRLVPAALLATAGTLILVREGFAAIGLRPSLADASALGAAALALLVPSLLRTTAAARLSGGLGHALVWTGLGMSLRSEVAALVGLGALVAFHGAEAVAASRGRPTVVTALAERCGPLRPLLEAVPTLVVTATVPFLAVVGGRQLPLVAEQRPRSGLVLAATSWGYVGLVLALRKGRRVPPAAMGIAVAACGIAVAAPSQVGTLIATASAALLSATCALLLGRPGLSAVSWALTGAAGLLGAARLGVPADDLHFVLYGGAAGLLLVPAAVDRLAHRSGGGIHSRWSQAPIAVGMAAFPAALAFVVADGRWVGYLMLGGAAVYALLGVCTRAGGTAVPAAALAAVAYADLIQRWRSPFEEPVVWMPLAALFVMAHLALPRRPLARMATDPGPGLLVVGLAVSALAAVLGIRSGGLGHVLVAAAALLGLLAMTRRSLWWGGAAATVLAAGGLAYGPHGWAALALALDALALGVVGTALRLRWWVGASSMAVAVAYTLLAWWRNWDEATLVVITAAAGGALAYGGAALVLRRVGGRVGLWSWPALAVGQAGAVTVLVTAAGLAEPGRFGVWAGLAAAEAVLATATAVVQERREWTFVSGGLWAAGYGLLAAWGEWTAVTVVEVSAAVAVVLGAAAPLLWWRARAAAVRMWGPVVFVLSQAAALAVCVAAGDLAHPGRFGVWAGVAAGEALLASGVASGAMLPALTAPAGTLWGAAYGLLAAWGEWNAETLLTVSALMSAGLAVGGLAVWLKASVPRLRLWAPAALVLAQAAAATVAVAAGSLPSLPDRLGVWAGVAAAEAVGLGLAALRPGALRYLQEASGCFTVAAVVLGLCALPDGPALNTLLCLGAVVSAAALVVAGGLRGSRWRSWAWLVGAGTVYAVPLITAVRLGGGDVVLGTVLIICGAGLMGAGIRSDLWALLYLGMLVWLAAGLFLAADAIGASPHAWAVPIAVVLLAIIGLERLRARLARRPPPDQLRLAEWALMAVPPLMAAVDMFRHRSFGWLLAAEGAAILLWALLSRVRRRLVVGLAAISAAVVIELGFLVVGAIRGGGGGGRVLAVLGVVAVLLIVIGSVIERSRARIGETVRRIGEALETWE